ncbi:O-antigen ligase [Pelomonas saccharophila]|uniref:O-antigen ligase n=1 Tax=Roseateles saccharophilus TaxID=304 RepID=A0ABU1YSY3_ROSSA|nr:O-antigen ligase family protein [Roseateles saccharophilus]MDR7271843.1 O-antigen ligase [Roseateles saccharophilus]
MSAPAHLMPGGISRTGHTLAAWAYFIIFPAFICYQILAIAGYISPALGGYFTAGASVAFPLLLLGLKRHRIPLSRGSSFVALTFACFLALWAFRVLTGMQAGADDEITSSHWAYIFKFIVLFLVARLLDGDAAGFHRYCTLALLAVAALVAVEGSGGQFLQASILQGLYAGFLLDYQGMAYAYMVMLAYCVLPLAIGWRFAVYLISFGALFLIGARSEFVGFVLMVGVVEYCKARSRPALLMKVLALIAVLAVFFFQYRSEFADNRIFAILEMSNDQSVMERAELHDAAVNTIQDKPLTGDYASYKPGNYAHDILSVWVDLGLVGFLLLLACIVAPLLVLLLQFARRSRDNLYVLTLAVCMVNALMVFFAKNYTYQMIPIALGLYCRYRAVRHPRTLLARNPARMLPPGPDLTTTPGVVGSV